MRWNRRSLLLVALATLFVLVRPAVAEVIATCEAPCESFPPPSIYACPTRTQYSYPWQDHFIPLARIGDHWMPNLGNGDSMTTVFSQDQGTYFPNGSTGFRETWYIARDPGSDRGALYRHYDPVSQNHADSPNVSEPGFGLQTLLGYPWTIDQGGQKPLRVYYSASKNDHMTWGYDLPTRTGEGMPTDWGTAAIWWQGSSSGRGGYQRFGNKVDQCTAVTEGEAAGVVLQNSKLRIKFNKIWGNAIGELKYLAGTGQPDLVSSAIGDMLQSVIYYGPAFGPGQQTLNPTQSGGVDSYNYGATRRWAGSPVLGQTVVTGGAGQPSYMTTDVKPFNFDFGLFTGTDQWTPLLWRGLFRITTTLGCKLSGVYYDDVIKVQFQATKDANAPFPETVMNMMQTGWFLMEPLGDCNVVSKRVTADLVNSNRRDRGESGDDVQHRLRISGSCHAGSRDSRRRCRG